MARPFPSTRLRRNREVLDAKYSDGNTETFNLLIMRSYYVLSQGMCKNGNTIRITIFHTYIHSKYFFFLIRNNVTSETEGRY